MEAGLPRLVGSGPTLPPGSQRVPLTGKAVAGARSLGYRQTDNVKNDSGARNEVLVDLGQPSAARVSRGDRVAAGNSPWNDRERFRRGNRYTRRASTRSRAACHQDLRRLGARAGHPPGGKSARTHGRCGRMACHGSRGHGHALGGGEKGPAGKRYRRGNQRKRVSRPRIRRSHGRKAGPFAPFDTGSTDSNPQHGSRDLRLSGLQTSRTTGSSGHGPDLHHRKQGVG